MTYLQYEYFAGGAVDVEFAIGWIIRINALAREEVHDVLGTILVAICGRNLFIQRGK